MTASKIVAAAASGVGGAGLDVDEVFDTFLWDGTGSAQTITNGIDLSGEGGMVWTKNRGDTNPFFLTDTVRGATKTLRSHTTSDQSTDTEAVKTFNSNGFSIGNDTALNRSGYEAVGWTFRKAPKFFDIINWTGDGNGDRTLSHSLDSDIGMAIVKNTNSGAQYSGNWQVFHRSMGTSQSDYLNLNTNDSKGSGSGVCPVRNPTTTNFLLRGGGAGEMNVNGVSYVAYLFAHNNSDGTFGPSTDQDIIHCGQYTTNASGLATVNIGFEPQWLLAKRTDASQDWAIFDVARGVYMNNDFTLRPNTTSAESAAGNQYNFTATGFTCAEHNANANYIFVAIRRGPLAEPENGTDVFSQTAVSGNNTDNRVITSGFQTDIVLHKKRSSGANWFLADRKRGERTSLKVLSTDLGNAEADYSNYIQEIDFQDGVEFGNNGDVNGGSPATYINYQWKRAPGFCDIVCYEGNGSNRTINHSLGAVPEMMWVKRRDATKAWNVYHSGTGNGEVLYLNETSGDVTSSAVWNDTTPTSSVFTVGTSTGTNANGGEYVAYLFGSVEGVSKLGSVNITNASNFDVDCGFSNGARFVMVKAFNQSSPWYVSDTARGINSGSADKLLFFNDSQVENTASDWIEPLSSGFTIKGNFWNGYNLIYWAIA